MALALVAVLAGCAGVGETVSCPDISGHYADRAVAGHESLSRLMRREQGDADGGSSAVTVTQTPGQLVVVAGSRRTVLEHGQDFACTDQGLRLVRPIGYGLDLGEVLVHKVSVFHTFTKDPQGALIASTSTKEEATVAHIPLSARERQGGSLRWNTVPAATARSGGPQ